MDADMLEPMKPLTTKGIETRAETKPRHLSVVISAMIIWVSNWRPLKIR